MRTGRDRKTALDLALECLARSGRLTLRATGSSMRPGIRAGSYVLIRRALPDEVAPGDVILARTADGVRLHRLIEIRGCGANAVLITRGDNHRHCDPPVRPQQLLGVLTRVEAPERPHWFGRVLAAAGIP